MFYLPTQICFGADAISRTENLITGFGSKALLVTGKAGAKASGALSDVCQLLDENGISWVLFDGISENPVLESVMAGALMMAQHSCDFVIGIGGGSPLDAAKAISIACANSLGIDQLYDVSLFRRAYPIVAVPTTSGTGSEVTQYAVLTDPRTQRKAGYGHPLAYPALAVCDPRYTVSMSREVTRNTGLDALSHLLEGLYSSKREALTFPMIHKGIRLVMDNLHRAMEDPKDIAARAALMQASLYGGMAIAQAGTTLQHSIGYPLTTCFGVPHGLANGLVMKQIMMLYYPHVGSVLDEMFATIGSSVEQFDAWLDAMDMRCDLRIDDAFIATKVPEVMGSRNMASNPFVVSDTQVARIYEELRWIQ